MSKVSIIIPCYNEEENLPRLYKVVTDIMRAELSEYDYEILMLDNKSTDSSRSIIRELCNKDTHVKAIFHRINCGSNANAFYGLQNSDGDCSIMLYADFQEPPELIPRMVHEWEKEHKCVCMIKTKSKENKLVYLARGIYYKVFTKMSKTSQMEQFDGFGCYDRSLVEIVKRIHDINPYFKGIVAEYAADHIEIEYEQQKRAAGKPSLGFWGYFDSAMLSFTTYTKSGLRIATFSGMIISGLSFLIGIVYLILKLLYWDMYPAGNIPILLAMLFLSGAQLFFLGFLGEYIMNINLRTIDRPMTIEEERINF